MKSKIGIEVIDAHSHFITASSMRQWAKHGRSISSFQNRTITRTDMKTIEIPDENFDAAKRWSEEMDVHGVSAIGYMIGPETYKEFLDAQIKFPGQFLGYLNINPLDDAAITRIRKAAGKGFRGIKLYPSSWKTMHVWDERCYPIYKEAMRHKMLVFCHFGITIGGEADLRHGNPIDIQIPARDFPELNFVIAHFGAGWFRETLLMQYQSDNVYMDSSGSNSWMKYLPYDLDIKSVFKHALRAGGPSKILFGTDSTFFPRGFRYNIMEEQFNALQSLKSEGYLNDNGIEQIFSGNVKRLTGFSPRE